MQEAIAAAGANDGVGQVGDVVGYDGLTWASPTLRDEWFAFSPGRYCVRIAGCGVAPYGQDKNESRDEWRLQVWSNAEGPDQGG
jgi:hypothetical protein